MVHSSHVAIFVEYSSQLVLRANYSAAWRLTDGQTDSGSELLVRKSYICIYMYGICAK